jgi:hypothetical protein
MVLTSLPGVSPMWRWCRALMKEHSGEDVKWA